VKRLTVLAATAVLLLATACSGDGAAPRVASIAATSRSGTGRSTGSAAPIGALAYSRCMRTHGVPQFPDPDGSGVLPKVAAQQLGVSDSGFESAQQACAHLLRSTDTQTQQTLSGMRDFARCMRSHGLRQWPDPTTDSTGTPAFDLHGRINPDSQQAVAVSDDCSSLLHPVPGQNGTTLCNGIGEPGCHHYG
jgi:hypothetical protein